MNLDFYHDAKLQILLIEDSDNDALGIQSSLSKCELSTFIVTRKTTLEDALHDIAKSFDAILMDLHLPDNFDLAGVEKLRFAATKTPLIVLSGTHNAESALQAIQLGAQDFLEKTKQVFVPDLLGRSIIYAIERQRLIRAREMENELQSMEQLAATSGTKVSASFYASRGLRESQPQIFEYYVKNYADFIALAIENRLYKVPVEKELRESLRDMAMGLGRKRATPKDLVEIHSTALKSKIKGESAAKIKAYVEEGRFLILELMGYLADFYSKYYIR